MLGQFDRSRDRLGVARYDDLSRRVDVRGRDDLTVGCLPAHAGRRFSVNAQQRRHRANSLWHRFLHAAPALMHEPDSLLELHRPSGYQC